jgi:hypothetical protein
MSIAHKRLAACGLLAAALWPESLAIAQDAKIPDFGKVGYGWYSVGDDFLPPLSGPGPVMSDPAYPYRSNTSGKQPTYRIADVRNPILQPWAVEQLKKSNAQVLSGKAPFNARERCWPAGVPGFEVFTLLRPVYFLQEKDKVVIVNEGDYQVRHVYLNVPHSPNPKPSWYGESVGHYENGDTLVIDTIGFNDKTYIDNYLTPHTAQLHVVERFKLVDGGGDHPRASTTEDTPRFQPTEGGRTLEVTVTVEDPGAFTASWSAVQTYREEFQGAWDEAICAENNLPHFQYETDVVPIPQAERAEF